MEEQVKHFDAFIDPLLACSMCRCLLREAQQLKCLNNCCRQCFSAAASKDGCQEGVVCRSCGAVTQVGSEKPNEFFDSQEKRCIMISESRTCDKCRENGEHDKPALEWCRECRHWLCGDCVGAHSQYYRQHVTRYFDEVKSFDEECLKPSAAACVIHNKPLDIACLSCEQVKCTSCWENCKEKKHKMHIVSDESFDNYVAYLVACLSTIERELLRKSAVLDKPMISLRDTKAARDRHLKDLNTRKRCVVDAVETAYQKMAEATKDEYDDLKAERDDAAKAAERIASDLSDAQDYIRRLVDSNEKCEIFKQQTSVQERLVALSVDLDNLSDSLARAVEIEASLPEDVEDVVGAWIGMPRLYSASSSTLQPASSSASKSTSASTIAAQQQQQSYSFNDASASFKLPVDCRDVALTKDGRSLLLAAAEHGLIELSSSSGHELSRWRPPEHKLNSSSSQDDLVQAVAALSDGRAAVSLHYAQLVVLLRRSEKGGSSTGGAAAGDDSWTVERRLDQLSWSARCLSACGDVLAASEGRLWRLGQWNTWLPGPRLQLMSLSSGRRLSAELQREYNIYSLAVTAGAVVTGSDELELGGGRRAAHVLDAHSLTDDGSDERLWRHVLCSSTSDNVEEEQLRGVCADSSGGCLYAAVQRSDRSSGRVSALSLADGSELRRVALSFSPATAAASTQLQPLLLPGRLSLSDDGAALAAAAEQQQQSSGRRELLLAVLCWNATTREWRTVTLHRSNSSMLQ